MKNELYIPLRDKIAAIVPEINQREMVIRNRVIDKLEGIYTCMRVWSAWSYGTMTEEDFGNAGEDADVVDGFVEILGRDIQIFDVLRAMEKTRKSDDDPILLHVTGEFDTYDRKDVLQLLKRVLWDTSLPLHEQSDELGEWLMTVIK